MHYLKRIVICCCLALVILFASHATIVDPTPCTKILGNETLNLQKPIPLIDTRTGPGDQIGTTAYDYQANGSFGQRIDVDDYDQAHIDWMWMNYPGANTRYCAWNARFADGSYYGETQACQSYTGYVQLDITRNANPDDQRSMIIFHEFGAPNYLSWIDVDGGNVWGAWPNNQQSINTNYCVWPYVCIANNGNIVVATGDYQYDLQHLFVSTDSGGSWTQVATIDSCGTLSQHVRASENSGSNKVVYVYTAYITDVPNVQLDNDVYYMLSTDGGVTWGAEVNITNYQPYPADSVRAYCNVNAVFDENDHLHIAWGGRRIDAGGMYDASKIFHWDEVTGDIHIVSSPSTYYSEPGGWWIATATSPSPGSWRMPADQPQLVVDHNAGFLYCLWHGNDDYNDGSAGGFFNGEFYASRSTDHGVTWSYYVNLTNTRTPGGAPGACDDEDYMTACPKVVNDSIFISYVEDKDAGGWPQTEGTLTDNPVRCWVFPKYIPGVTEYGNEAPHTTTVSLAPNPATRVTTLRYTVTASGNVVITLFDVTGRYVEELENADRSAGVYSLDIDTRKLANGTYFVVVNAPDKKASSTLVVVH
jgi:hypothetical protein